MTVSRKTVKNTNISRTTKTIHIAKLNTVKFISEKLLIFKVIRVMP